MQVDTLNGFVSMDPDTVPAKMLLTRFFKVYLQSHKDEIKCV
jgi:hypothetical protein